MCKVQAAAPLAERPSLQGSSSASEMGRRNEPSEAESAGATPRAQSQTSAGLPNGHLSGVSSTSAAYSNGSGLRLGAPRSTVDRDLQGIEVCNCW